MQVVSMSNVTSPGELTVDMLRATFPAWRIFRAAETWLAIRGGIQVWDGPSSLVVRALAAPDLIALAERLCAQAWLDGLEDDELAAVYRGDQVGSDP
jgi:hypothetical protein